MNFIIVIVLGFLLLVVAFLYWCVSFYNELVVLRNRFRNAFTQIGVQLVRRHDLIPNLVEAVKGYMAHEHGTLEAVMAARSSAMVARASAVASPGLPSAMHALAGAEGVLTASLSRLLAVTESYPVLKANENVKGLMDELASTENRVAFSRQAYNDAVMVFNVAVQQFPSCVLAEKFGFVSAEPLIVSTEDTKAPIVSF